MLTVQGLIYTQLETAEELLDLHVLDVTITTPGVPDAVLTRVETTRDLSYAAFTPSPRRPVAQNHFDEIFRMYLVSSGPQAWSWSRPFQLKVSPQMATGADRVAVV